MLRKLTDRVFIKDFEHMRDRPALGLIVGDRLTLAVDAGHSAAHVAEFYEELAAKGLKLPDLTAVTHWHWDHTFAMHRVHGLTMANRRTDEYLRNFEREIGTKAFLELDEPIRLEYADDLPVVVVPADIVYEDRLTIDLGGVTAQIFRAPSPHTDDASFIFIPEEKVLFVGDAYSGPFPTYEVSDMEKLEALIKVIEGLDADYVIHSHVEEKDRNEILKMLHETLNQ